MKRARKMERRGFGAGFPLALLLLSPRSSLIAVSSYLGRVLGVQEKHLGDDGVGDKVVDLRNLESGE